MSHHLRLKLCPAPAQDVHAAKGGWGSRIRATRRIIEGHRHPRTPVPHRTLLGCHEILKALVPASSIRHLRLTTSTASQDHDGVWRLNRHRSVSGPQSRSNPDSQHPSSKNGCYCASISSRCTLNTAPWRAALHPSKTT